MTRCYTTSWDLTRRSAGQCSRGRRAQGVRGCRRIGWVRRHKTQAAARAGGHGIGQGLRAARAIHHLSLAVRLGKQHDQSDAKANRSQGGACEETDDGPSASAVSSTRRDRAANSGTDHTHNQRKTEVEENDWPYVHSSDARSFPCLFPSAPSTHRSVYGVENPAFPAHAVPILRSGYGTLAILSPERGHYWHARRGSAAGVGEAINRRGKMCRSREGSDTRLTPRPPGRLCVVPDQRAPGIGRVSDKVSTRQVR